MASRFPIMVRTISSCRWCCSRGAESRAGQKDFADFLPRVRRYAIFAIMAMAYFYYRRGQRPIGRDRPVVLRGHRQLAPRSSGGPVLAARDCARRHAGMLVGFAVWLYTMFLPSFLDGDYRRFAIAAARAFGIEALRPQALFGADLPPLLHGVLWSLSLNLLTYIVLSLAREPVLDRTIAGRRVLCRTC